MLTDTKSGGIYNTVKQALYDTLVNCLNNSDDRVDVYKSPFQNVLAFPALFIDIAGRTKESVGVGGTYRFHIDFVVWVYTDILESVESEQYCLHLTDKIENFLLQNKTLHGKVSSLSIDEEIQFGTVEQGEANFLQGARIPVKIKTLLLREGTSCQELKNGGDCSCG